MTQRLKIGDRVLVGPNAFPNGKGTVTRADGWTASVKMDADEIEYFYGECVLILIAPMESPNIGFSAKEGYHNWVDGMGSFEVFWWDKTLECEGQDDSFTDAGWYWWPCFPGCLPDGEATGPFYSSSAAYNDARG